MNNPSPEQQHPWYQNLSVVRWIFAIIGILVMVFSGGCSLFFLGNYLLSPYGAGGYEMVVFMGIAAGFVIMLLGVLTWWLAAKTGRNNGAKDE